MCWRRKIDPVIPVVASKIALIFTLGDYPGTQNDLGGPPYDHDNVDNFFKTNYPEFTVRKFKNSEVTRNNFRDIVTAQISILKVGDYLIVYYSGHGTNGYDANEPDGYREGLYLYDGAFWDDEFTGILQGIPQGAKVVIILDSCFAKGSTTDKGGKYRKQKFVETQEIKRSARSTRKILKSRIMNYVVIAACEEDQTSDDTSKGGVFTLAWLDTWIREHTWKDWTYNTAMAIDDEHEQIPNIEGDEELSNSVIFK